LERRSERRRRRRRRRKRKRRRRTHLKRGGTDGTRQPNPESLCVGSRRLAECAGGALLFSSTVDWARQKRRQRRSNAYLSGGGAA
jgi:hypothetical protein